MPQIRYEKSEIHSEGRNSAHAYAKQHNIFNYEAGELLT
jgi:hypothetical protein